MSNKSPKRGMGYLIIAIVFLAVGTFSTYALNASGVFPAREALAAAAPAPTIEPLAAPTSEAEETFPADTAIAENTFPVATDAPGATFPVYEEDEDSEPLDSGLNYYNPVIAIAENCGPSVVGVINNELMVDYQRGTLTEEEAGMGSGVIISADGYIVTNNHVVENNSSVSVILAGTSEAISATIIGVDTVTDIAVLKIDKTGLPYARLGDSDQVKVGELVVAIGNPLGMQLSGSVSVGYVSALDRQIFSEEGEGYIQTDAAINPGNSGGGLFNDKGEMIGMPTSKLDISASYYSGTVIEGLGFAIPSNQIRSIAEQLMQYGEIVRPTLGVRVNDVIHSDFSPAGIFVVSVDPGSPAEAAKVQANDVITSVDGARTETTRQLKDYLATKSYGDVIEIEVYRNRKPLFIEVKLFKAEPLPEPTATAIPYFQ